jgi:hypothetical protein
MGERQTNLGIQLEATEENSREKAQKTQKFSQKSHSGHLSQE